MGTIETLERWRRLARVAATVALNRKRIAFEEAAALARYLLVDRRVPPTELARMEDEAVMRNYAPPETLVLAAQDCFLYDEDGHAYADFQAAYSANNAGNCNPRVTGANHFASALSSVLSRARRHRQLPLLAHEIQRALGINYKLLPMNSGCEAIEGATLLAKLAFNRHPRFKNKLHSSWQREGGYRIAVCENNFHGRSSWAKAVSSNPAYRDPFAPNTLEGEVTWVEFGNSEQLAEVFRHHCVAAFVVEPMQCEGGMNIPPPNYFRRVRELCDLHNVLLVMDEVQTGLGRTGAMLGQQNFFDGRVEADIIALAKSISGGQEVASAVLAKPEYADLIRPSEHGSTFGGNPKACVTMRAALRELEDRNLCSRACGLGGWFLDELRSVCTGLPDVVEVRGLGLAIGIEMKGHRADEVCARLRQTPFLYRGREISGCWTNSTHGITDETTVIRVSPPLTIPPDLVCASIVAFARALGHPTPDAFRFPAVEKPRSLGERVEDFGGEMAYYGHRAHRLLRDLKWVNGLR